MKRIETSQAMSLGLLWKNFVSILYTLNEKDWDFKSNLDLMASIVALYLFYIPWMKRIETCTHGDLSNAGVLLLPWQIYSIYLEWKGLRLFFHLLERHTRRCIYSIYLEWKGLRPFDRNWSCILQVRLKVSILYTLNEKDWDVEYRIQYMSLHYLLLYLFYIPWMKRIETHSKMLLNNCASLSGVIYSIYLEWKGRYNC